MYRPALVLAATLMIGCAASTAQPTQTIPAISETATVTEIAEATAIAPTDTALPPTEIQATSTITPTPLPTLTATPADRGAPTQIQYTPVLEGSSIWGDVVFTKVIDPDCELPCWQGLRPGISTRFDVQDTMDEVFNFRGTVDFFDPPPVTPLGAGLIHYDESENYYTGYRWNVGSGSYWVGFVLDRSTDLLRYMTLSWIAPLIKQPTIQTVIREMGQPSHILVEGSLTNEPSFGIVDFAFIYESGTVFLFKTSIDIRSETVDGVTREFSTLCLNEPLDFNKVFLTYPYLNGLNAVNTDQKTILEHVIGTRDGSYYMRPIDRVLDITIEDFTQMALEEENGCIRFGSE